MTNNGAKILLVENNTLDQEVMMGALGGNGFAGTVHLASDPQEALNFVFGRGDPSSRQASRNLPKLILLGLNPPQTDSLEVLRALKQHAVARDIPVVVMSSSGEASDMRQCYEEGANSYVRKPAELAEYEGTLAIIASYWLHFNELPFAHSSLAHGESAQPDPG
jgi:two-component system response regulator